FDPQDLGVAFQDQTGFGRLSSDFIWQPECDSIDFSDGTTFTFYLIADDFDKCRVKNFDTLAFEVLIDPGFNNKPEFDELAQQDIRVNESVRIDVLATDLDATDRLTVDLLPGFLPPPGEEFSFTPGEGIGSAAGVIEWTPPCELLGGTFDTRDFRVFLLVSDNDCPTPKYDTVQVDLTVNNLPVVFDNFEPPNVFTPNNDGTNDVFVLNGNVDARFNLPLDNCQEQFQYMTVVDRSGREVFHTEDRDFVWDGLGASAGVYFYFIKYTNAEFRGSVTLIN
ncbi:MAG: gliding motility-associated C-terminal domain-containing protein, partial [Bacteroidota bacterium]